MQQRLSQIALRYLNREDAPGTRVSLWSQVAARSICSGRAKNSGRRSPPFATAHTLASCYCEGGSSARSFAVPWVFLPASELRLALLSKGLGRFAGVCRRHGGPLQAEREREDQIRDHLEVLVDRDLGGRDRAGRAAGEALGHV